MYKIRVCVCDKIQRLGRKKLTRRTIKKNSMNKGRLAYFLSKSGSFERTAPSHTIISREHFGRCGVRWGLELEGPELPWRSRDRRRAAMRELSCRPARTPPV